MVGLPPGAKYKTFDTFDRGRQPEAFDAARRFLDEKRSLILWGNNGLGKTHLACAIVNALLAGSCYATGIYTYEDRHGVVLFTPLYFALDLLKRTYQQGYDGMGEGWYYRRWGAVPVLVLDEVGMTGLDEASPFTRRVVFQIVNMRYAVGDRPIVMTSNKSPSELGEWITPSAVDRLFEMGSFVEMRGESYRLGSER